MDCTGVKEQTDRSLLCTGPSIAWLTLLLVVARTNSLEPVRAPADNHVGHRAVSWFPTACRTPSFYQNGEEDDRPAPVADDKMALDGLQHQKQRFGHGQQQPIIYDCCRLGAVLQHVRQISAPRAGEVRKSPSAAPAGRCCTAAAHPHQVAVVADRLRVQYLGLGPDSATTCAEEVVSDHGNPAVSLTALVQLASWRCGSKEIFSLLAVPGGNHRPRCR